MGRLANIAAGSACALLLYGCSDQRWIAPPDHPAGTLIAVREEAHPERAQASGLTKGAAQLLEPGHELIWLGYDASLEALDVYAGVAEFDHPNRILRDDPVLTQPNEIYELRADGPLEWSRLTGVPGWVLALSVPFATPLPCPSFGPPNVIELPDRPNAVAFFRGQLLAARSEVRALSTVDTADPALSVVARPLGEGPPITALHASPVGLFLGDQLGNLWRIRATEFEEPPVLLGRVSSSSCAVAALDGPEDGSQVIAASTCLDVAAWSGNSGVVGVLRRGDEPEPFPLAGIQLAWASPGEAVMLSGDGLSPPKIRRVTAFSGVEHLSPSYLPDSVARFERGVRIAAHSRLAVDEASFHCGNFGCGTEAPDAVPGDWEIDTTVPLFTDTIDRMVPFSSGLVFAASSGKVGYFSFTSSCRPAPTTGLGSRVRSLEQEDGRIAYSAEGTSVVLVELK